MQQITWIVLHAVSGIESAAEQAHSVRLGLSSHLFITDKVNGRLLPSAMGRVPGLILACFRQWLYLKHQSGVSQRWITGRGRSQKCSD